VDYYAFIKSPGIEFNGEHSEGKKGKEDSGNIAAMSGVLPL
jgi:hypothetical protein